MILGNTGFSEVHTLWRVSILSIQKVHSGGSRGDVYGVESRYIFLYHNSLVFYLWSKVDTYMIPERLILRKMKYERGTYFSCCKVLNPGPRIS